MISTSCHGHVDIKVSCCKGIPVRTAQSSSDQRFGPCLCSQVTLGRNPGCSTVVHAAPDSGVVTVEEVFNAEAECTHRKLITAEQIPRWYSHRPCSPARRSRQRRWCSARADSTGPVPSRRRLSLLMGLLSSHRICQVPFTFDSSFQHVEVHPVLQSVSGIR